MANDRIILKCKTCGMTGLLATYFPGSGGCITNTDRLAAFVEKHMRCSSNDHQGDLGGDECFSVFAQSHDNSNELIDPDPEFELTHKELDK